MKSYDRPVSVGVREIDTNRLLAVYPEQVQGSADEVEEKVKFWFYQRNCEAEDILRNCVVDAVSEDELKQFGKGV